MPVAKGQSLDSFRKSYDKKTIIPAKIKAALGQLGPDSWEAEGEFIKRCGIASSEFAQYRDTFAHHCVELPRRRGAINGQAKRAWAGSAALATKMREMVA